MSSETLYSMHSSIPRQILIQKILQKKIRIPVCYDERFGIDLENIVSKYKISIEEIIKIHTEETYLVYCLGFLPGFAYMGKVNAAIQIARHASLEKKYRLEVLVLLACRRVSIP